jgi:DNA-directed RNA polymerase specialized sigma24 family protein
MLGENETVGLSVPSAEDEALKLNDFESVYAKHISFAALALNKLTEVQRRRYVMYHAHGKSYREIAEAEKVHFTTVEESILSAEKCIQKLLMKRRYTPLHILEPFNEAIVQAAFSQVGRRLFL